MQFKLENLLPEHINNIFQGLNKLEHGVVRQTFDHILKQVQDQEKAADPRNANPQMEQPKAAVVSD